MFKPTFKFDKDSDAYDTSAKQRVPSWCDRVCMNLDQRTDQLRCGGDARHVTTGP